MLQENEGTISTQDQPTGSDIFVSVEMSRSKWVVGIHTPLADKIGLHTMACGDVEALRWHATRACFFWPKAWQNAPLCNDAFDGSKRPPHPHRVTPPALNHSAGHDRSEWPAKAEEWLRKTSAPLRRFRVPVFSACSFGT